MTIILHHKYGLSIRSSLNNWYQSDVPEPFTDNLQANNLLTSVEGQVLLFYLLNAWGKLYFCFKMNCFCKLMLEFLHVEFLVSSERVKNFAPAEAGQTALRNVNVGFALPIKFIYLLFMFLVNTHASK